jgi:hypothetical protein
MDISGSYARILAAAVCVVELVLNCPGAVAADVSLYTVHKRVEYYQTDAGAPILYTYPYIAYANVYLTASNSATSASVTTPNGNTVPLKFGYAVNMLPALWAFGKGEEYVSQAEMDAAWPNGNYKVSIYTANQGLKQPVISLAGDFYPTNPPHIQNLVAAQSLNAAQDFVLQWDTFSGGKTNDLIYVRVLALDGTAVFNTPLPDQANNLSGTATSVTIPAGTLASSQAYSAEVAFFKIVTHDTTNYPGAIGATAYERKTCFWLATAATTNAGPTITTQPQDVSTWAGYSDDVGFYVAAKGVGPVRYEWRKGGVPILSGTNQWYGFIGVQISDSGNRYDVIVTDDTGSVTSRVATLTVTNLVPIIYTQPQSQSVGSGSNATCWIYAQGSPTLGYQWRFNNVKIAGAQADNYTITNAQPANAGSYSVVVTNAGGAATSAVAVLTVTTNGAPRITSQPQSLWVSQGSSAALNVTASGTQPLDYQWRLNGGKLAGAKSSSYAITNAQPGNAGSYSVVVTNVAGAVTSAVAVVTVVSSGQSNLVLALDGSSSSVSVPSAPELQNATGMTVEMWMYPRPPTDPNHGWFIVKGDGQSVDSLRSYELSWAVRGGDSGIGVGAEFSFFLNTSTWALLGAPLVYSNWVHVAATFSSASGLFQLFTNGVLAAATTNDHTGAIPLIGQTIRQTTLPVYIGGELGVMAAGFADEVRIWSKARTQAEIAGNRSCRLTGGETNLAGYWNFDDSTASDLTGHGHNGSLAGGASIVPEIGGDAVHAGCIQTRFAGIRLTPDRLPSMTLIGSTGTLYRFDVSSNLVDWVPWVTLPNPDGTLQVIDSDAPNHPRRFYRALKR